MNDVTLIDILDFADQLSTIAILLAALVGLYRRWWVPGWAYRQSLERFSKMEQEKDAWRQTALAAADIATDAFDALKKAN